MLGASDGGTPLHPHLQACLAVLEELYDDLVATLRPLDETCLNWTPRAPETNSIAALVRHVIGSNDAWLARAAGEPVVRDRDAEFRARDTADRLVAAVERSRADARQRLALLDGVDPGTIRTVRRLGASEDADLSVAWCVVHALIHTGEHWGQIQINRQLYGADPGESAR